MLQYVLLSKEGASIGKARVYKENRLGPDLPLFNRCTCSVWIDDLYSISFSAERKKLNADAQWRTAIAYDKCNADPLDPTSGRADTDADACRHRQFELCNV